MSDDISSGAAMDIQQATQLARAMVMHWGMSDKLGNGAIRRRRGICFSRPRHDAHERSIAKHTAQEIDAEVKRIIDDGYKTAQNILFKPTATNWK